MRENIPTKFFRSQLEALWEPTDQRLRGQINNPSSRSHGWGQRVIADTFLPCCSEPQQGHPEPLDTPAGLVIIIVHWLLFSSRNLLDWFTVLYCTCQRSLECDRHHDNLRVQLFLFYFRTGKKKIPRPDNFIHGQRYYFSALVIKWTAVKDIFIWPSQRKETLLQIKMFTKYKINCST